MSFVGMRDARTLRYGPVLVVSAAVALAAGCGSDVTENDAGPLGENDAGSVSDCTVATCEAGQATSCDGTLSLDCGAIGALCADFTSLEGDEFRWCSCGRLPEGQAECLADGSGAAALCEGGIAVILDCPAGSACTPTPEDPQGVACVCDNLADGFCPGDPCIDDPDCSGGGCVPDCAGRECGGDGCGGSCGSCAAGETCNSSGTCSGGAPCGRPGDACGAGEPACCNGGAEEPLVCFSSATMLPTCCQPNGTACGPGSGWGDDWNCCSANCVGGVCEAL